MFIFASPDFGFMVLVLLVLFDYQPSGEKACQDRLGGQQEIPFVLILVFHLLCHLVREGAVCTLATPVVCGLSVGTARRVDLGNKWRWPRAFTQISKHNNSELIWSKQYWVRVKMHPKPVTIM